MSNNRIHVVPRGDDPDESPDKGELVPQAHGGALRNGSKPGESSPGIGRPSSAVREHCRGSFEERIPVLEAIADGGHDATNSDRIRAIDLLGKYGGIEKMALAVERPEENEMTPELLADMWERLCRVRSIEDLEKHLVTTVREQASCTAGPDTAA